MQPIQGPAVGSLWYAVIGGYTHLSGEKYFTSLYGAPPVWATGGAGMRVSFQWRCVPRRSSRVINQSLSFQEELWLLCSFIRFVLTTNTLYIIYDLWTLDCNTMCQAKHEKMHTEITGTADTSHKSSCLSFCISKAECSLWIWGLAAQTLSNITKGIRAGCRNHPDSKGSHRWWLHRPDFRSLPLRICSKVLWENTWFPLTLWSSVVGAHIAAGQSNEGWHVRKHCHCNPFSVFLSLQL